MFEGNSVFQITFKVGPVSLYHYRVGSCDPVILYTSPNQVEERIQLRFSEVAYNNHQTLQDYNHKLYVILALGHVFRH
jgi:hypothetical protein